MQFMMAWLAGVLEVLLPGRVKSSRKPTERPDDRDVLV
jgi:hypothetical protein